MDIFRTLAGGGTRFDKRRFQNDLKIFGGADEASTSSTSVSSRQASSGKHKRAAADSARSTKSASNGAKVIVPDGLDFFGSAAKAKSTTSAIEREERLSNKKGKRKAAEVESDNTESDSDEEEEGCTDEPPVTKANLSAFLKKHKLKTKGTDVPLPMASWAELESRFSVSPWLRNNLKKYGWEVPTAIQKGAMPVILADRDLLAGAPTGSGKTLAFLLPLLHHLRAPNKKENFRAVIVSPTRELAQQIYEQLKRLSEGRNFRICVLTKTADASAVAKGDDIRKRKKFDILITTPLRLVHAVEKEEADLSNVRHLVLDEADRLLEEGFLEQTDSILAACSHPELRKALFSATLPAGVEEMAKTFMVDECRVIVGTKDSATETIQQELQFVGSEDGKLHALRSLIQEGGLKPPVLLFVQSIDRAKDLFHELVYDGLHVDVIHSDRPKLQREGVISAFKRGDVWVLICTELMARGIDFRGVQLVINYDFPQSVQSYIHRIGRTGRAGRQGRAITYFTKEDAIHLKTVVNVMRQSGCDVPQWMLELKNPNKKERKKLKQKAPERKEIRTSAASSVGRRLANKKRDMVAASKRRKVEDDNKGTTSGNRA
ncbi:probable ROK1 - ATP-dependent RNA helicase [Melanopsichium pennsylvanicum]|uniref:RNA helicase n=2 Tax=Melanopsichium pennsylvanicum TaxID=63383 RepID=A0AAJ5C867_9BASI|nr:probable ROK1-ATP-dependent RNA helicase [Melanopsichium pennsylvanicum 4]SNX87661.1 probable ROK1 - ATP-dependent RNA helicase [Melanopsichium pennsylvanicum]